MSGSDGSDRHGWINTGVVSTRFGDLEFENGYPADATAAALREQLVVNRAVEAYLRHVPAVGVMSERLGLGNFGARRSNQVVIWESLMDAQTLLLTAFRETVYAMQRTCI